MGWVASKLNFCISSNVQPLLLVHQNNDRHEPIQLVEFFKCQRDLNR